MKESNIKNIIFDLGGVLLNIDYLRTVQAFKDLGLKEPEKAFTKEVQDELFQKFERGQIVESSFLSTLSELMPNADDESIIGAWNALLGDFPKERFDFLQDLKKTYRLGVLSNTNAIHEKAFMDIIDRSVGWQNFRNLFVGIEYSHVLGERKPDLKAFKLCMQKLGFKAHETLFIDDTKEHVEAAKRTGLRAIHLQKGEAKHLIQAFI